MHKYFPCFMKVLDKGDWACNISGSQLDWGDSYDRLLLGKYMNWQSLGLSFGLGFFVTRHHFLVSHPIFELYSVNYSTKEFSVSVLKQVTMSSPWLVLPKLVWWIYYVTRTLIICSLLKLLCSDRNNPPKYLLVRLNNTPANLRPMFSFSDYCRN